MIMGSTTMTMTMSTVIRMLTRMAMLTSTTMSRLMLSR
jgi:hypothetical protein